MLGGALLLTLAFAGAQAKADRVQFRSNGGRWSHTRHAGWHRYWGGPSVGYYYAASPVYVVSGYREQRYYSGSEFWYSNPSFGLRVNNGGGDNRRIIHRTRDNQRTWEDNRDRRDRERRERDRENRRHDNGVRDHGRGQGR